MGEKWKPDTIDTIEREMLQRCGYVKRMPEERKKTLIVVWIPREGRKRERARKMWMEGVQAAVERGKFRTGSMEKRRGVAFGLWETGIDR